MADDNQNDHDPAASNPHLSGFGLEGLNFSGTSLEGSPWEKSWLAFTDGEYYHRCRGIMLGYGMGEGDVEMILANFWEAGYISAMK